MAPNSINLKLEFSGIVQGVGFRPFIFKLANEFHLKGFVLNHDRGVTVEVEGNEITLQKFLLEISSRVPPAARIDSIKKSYLPPKGYIDFEIRQSPEPTTMKFVAISPDLALCQDCKHELWDKTNRRYFYPFINCTNCGPRLTIIQDVPYDRPLTTMSEFEMCAECAGEYRDPTNRRFHAQPNACAACGPRIWFTDNQGLELQPSHSAQSIIQQAVLRLREGSILAVKGIGGFHFVCDAKNDFAVERLREKKLREAKPFAVMFADLSSARIFVEINEAEKTILKSAAHPIVLLHKKKAVDLAFSVAPNNPFLGVMLPYSPLHDLLVQMFGGPLVMTSANLRDEPIAYSNEDALNRLKQIADYFLLHNRKIHIRTDDSVLRVFNNKEYFYRRSRGYAPAANQAKLKFRAPILAVGGELKNTICLAKASEAILSHHIGDLTNLATFESFQQAIVHYQNLFNITPEFVAHDLHPEYLSSKWVLEKFGIARNVIGVQHHHAHIAACLGENNYDGKVIGVALDGTGFGLDGTIWGGEFLIADKKTFVRAGHLRPATIVAGAAAIKFPWKIALSYLHQANLRPNPEMSFLKNISRSDVGNLLLMLERNRNTFVTSSCGRLFDAVSGLIGLVAESKYEGQAAIELENILAPGDEEYNFAVDNYQLDWRPVIVSIATDVKDNVSLGKISQRFHNGLVVAIVKLSERLAVEYGIRTVALSGGCFLNNYLLTRLSNQFRERGINVLTHAKVPSNDGGIAFGQAVVANEFI